MRRFNPSNRLPGGSDTLRPPQEPLVVGYRTVRTRRPPAPGLPMPSKVARHDARAGSGERGPRFRSAIELSDLIDELAAGR